MDKVIVIERSGAPVIDGDGVPRETWDDLMTLRAQIIQASTEEYTRSYGASDETVTIFRTRYVAGLTNADRVRFEGQTYDIKEFKAIGRGKGLEIRCKSFGAMTS